MWPLYAAQWYLTKYCLCISIWREMIFCTYTQFFFPKRWDLWKIYKLMSFFIYYARCRDVFSFCSKFCCKSFLKTKKWKSFCENIWFWQNGKDFFGGKQLVDTLFLQFLEEKLFSMKFSLSSSLWKKVLFS